MTNQTSTPNPELKIIARCQSEFPTKFGLPRQSGLIQELQAKIIFEPEYRNQEALRGLADFSHIWLLWQFSQAIRDGWSPTVRPPRLGGNSRLGVFATRSPFRPNPIGLSCVKLDKIELHPPQGPILHISGADLMDGTPIYDIKPYLPFTDNHPEASGGFAQPLQNYALKVEICPDLQMLVPDNRLAALKAVLAHDPRPAYQEDPERVYGFDFAGLAIKFTVYDQVLTVREIKKSQA